MPGHRPGPCHVNLIGNTVIAPHGDGLVFGVAVLGPRPVSLFVKDNYGPYRTRDDQPEWLFVSPRNRARTRLVPRPQEGPPITTRAAARAYEEVLAGAGCTRPMRDPVDERILADVHARRTRVIREPAEVGGWPDLPRGTPPADSDHDGMPDPWERQYAFAPHNPRDACEDSDGDGYTNLEEFLNGTHPRR